MRRVHLITIALLALAASIGLGAFLSRPADRPTALNPPTPRTDKAPLMKRFPFLGNFEKCSWVGGVKDDRSKGLVPAPSSYYLKGFVVLDPAQTKNLLGNYGWVESEGGPLLGPANSLGEGFPGRGGPFLESDDLIRALPSMTEFAGGTILLRPVDNLLYLDLQAN